MTDDDWDNLQFLLNASEATLADWYEKTGLDDHEYASDLLALYSEELTVKSILLKEDVPDLDTANKIIKNYML